MSYICIRCGAEEVASLEAWMSAIHLHAIEVDGLCTSCWLGFCKLCKDRGVDSLASFVDRSNPEQMVLLDEWLEEGANP